MELLKVIGVILKLLSIKFIERLFECNICMLVLVNIVGFALFALAIVFCVWLYGKSVLGV